ncbi:MAG TPA: PLP-dependent aminotransferase family protein [Polyangiaceae bacterium]|nr:PLP-dependent aminotransferase family protein [Polyangiaceae bacterium]
MQETTLAKPLDRARGALQKLPMRALLPPLILDSTQGPLQQQVCESLRQAILAGWFAPGGRVPSSRALADSLGVSRTTALAALDQLRHQGYLASRRGSGTFVARELPDEVSLSEPRVHRADTHPVLSARGRELLTLLPPARRLGASPRPFRLGTPALDLVPVQTWAKLAQRRIRAIKSSWLDYADPAGLRELREAIAALVRRRGTTCDPDSVFIVGGAQRGLEFITQLLLDPGDSVWMEEPGYPGAVHAFRVAGARPCFVPVDEDGLNVEAGRKASPAARLAYVSPSHQFPLGVPMSLPRRYELLRWAQAAESWIVEDDYDCEFRYRRAPIHCLHGLDPDGRVIYVGTFSKTLFPALRLGFLILPQSIHRSFVAARTTADVHSSSIDQLVLASFITEGHYERHLRRVQAAYRERLEALTEAAERFCGGVLRLRTVQSGLHAVADLYDVPAETVFQEACARGVEVAPLAQYYLTRAQPANALLLGFGPCHPEQFAPGMVQLARAIEAARRGAHTERADIQALYGRLR